MAPKQPMVAPDQPKLAEDGPRCAKDRVKMTEHRLKTPKLSTPGGEAGKMAPKRPQNSSKTAPKRPQDRPRWPPNGPKMAQDRGNWAKIAKDRPKIGPRSTKMAQDPPKSENVAKTIGKTHFLRAVLEPRPRPTRQQLSEPGPWGRGGRGINPLPQG